MTGQILGTYKHHSGSDHDFRYGHANSGAAWAAVIGNLVSVLYYLYCYSDKSLLNISFNRKIFTMRYITGIFSIGIPSGLNHVLYRSR